ncbi:MAG: hypothetical protein HY059_18170 [Proteobacteria bacterium]|nr:hypothetical protein [Pseudomonadota bacterium]
MRKTFFAVWIILSGTLCDASARPINADCPIAHPENSSLKFVSATLDQSRPGMPWPPDADMEEKQPAGMILLVTHYASYQILRDQVLVCSYSEIRNRRAVHIDSNLDVRIFMPGILMRCEGMRPDRRVPETGDWVRRWCTHDPDE